MDNLKAMKGLVLMGMGAGAVLAYQKYSEPVMEKLQTLADDAMKSASKKLDDMM